MIRPLQDQELRLALAEACGSEYRALVLLMGFSGLLWCEAAALSLRDCEASGQGVLLVNEAEEHAGGVRVKPRRRGYVDPVQISPPVQEVLAEHLSRLRGRAKDTLLFTDPESAPLRLDWFTETVWKPALQMVGLPAGLKVGELAVELLRAGWDDKAKVLGGRGAEMAETDPIPDPSRAPADDGMGPAAGEPYPLPPDIHGLDEVAFWPTPAAYACRESFPLSGWREWDSVHYLLLAPCIRADAAPFIDERRQSIDWTGLKRAARSWGHGARLLMALAANLWNSSGRICVRELVDTLDAGNFARALRAIELSRGIAPEQASVGIVR